MIADPEDIVMFLIAFAPIVFLFVWLKTPKSAVRIVLLIVSLVFFFLFLPVTSLYIIVTFLYFMPWLSGSSVAYDVAWAVVMVVPVVCLLLTCALLYRRIRER